MEDELQIKRFEEKEEGGEGEGEEEGVDIINNLTINQTNDFINPNDLYPYKSNDCLLGCEWIHCFCIADFDVELGQKIEHVIPPTDFSQEELLNMGYLSIPDTNGGESVVEEEEVFTFRLKKTNNNSSYGNYQTLLNGNDENCDFYFGFVFFYQQKNANLPRGYLQKSVIIITEMNFIELYKELISIIGRHFFQSILPNYKPKKTNEYNIDIPNNYNYYLDDENNDNNKDNSNDDIKDNKNININLKEGEQFLTSLYQSIASSWPKIREGEKVKLDLLNYQLIFDIPNFTNSNQSLNNPLNYNAQNFTNMTSLTITTPIENINKNENNISNDNNNDNDNNTDKKNEKIIIEVKEEKLRFVYFKKILRELWRIWEMVLTNQPIIVISPHVYLSADYVLSLVSLISPLKYGGDYRPYFSIYDSDFKRFSLEGQITEGVILGSSNPFFLKTFSHYPNIINFSIPSTDNINNNNNVSTSPVKPQSPSVLNNNSNNNNNNNVINNITTSPVRSNNSSIINNVNNNNNNNKSNNNSNNNNNIGTGVRLSNSTSSLFNFSFMKKKNSNSDIIVVNRKNDEKKNNNIIVVNKKDDNKNNNNKWGSRSSSTNNIIVVNKKEEDKNKKIENNNNDNNNINLNINNNNEKKKNYLDKNKKELIDKLKLIKKLNQTMKIEYKSISTENGDIIKLLSPQKSSFLTPFTKPFTSPPSSPQRLSSSSSSSLLDLSFNNGNNDEEKQSEVVDMKLIEMLEMNNDLLARHFRQRTEKFLLPFERYFSSLLPLFRTISAFTNEPKIREFSESEFLSSLSAYTKKKDTMKLYRRFLKSKNFQMWKRGRENEARENIRDIYLKCLANIDISISLKNRSNTEIIDLYMRLHLLLNELTEKNVKNSNHQFLVNRLNEQINEIQNSQLIPISLLSTK